MPDRTYHAWETLRRLEPTPRARRRFARRAWAFTLLCAATLGYLLAVAPWGALVFFAGIVGYAYVTK